MIIEISKGRQYDSDGFRAKTSTHMWDGRMAVVDGETIVICDGGETPNALTGYGVDQALIAQFDIAAARVMTTGVSETIEIATETRKPMTDAEHAAADDHEKRVNDMMTLGGTTY